MRRYGSQIDVRLLFILAKTITRYPHSLSRSTGDARRRAGETNSRVHHCVRLMVLTKQLDDVRFLKFEFTVDLNKPLVFQVGHLGEAYQEWVHQPIVSKEGPRFFANDFLEFLTRTVWWAVPTIWLPVVCWCLSMSIQRGNTLPRLALMAAAGIFLWTLIEYTLHRFLFHIKTKSYWGNTAHYLLHGCHHKHPMDGLRLVFPPAAAAILCVPFWNLVKLLATPSAAPALFGESEAISSEPSLQNSKQGVWNNFFTLGHCLWHIAPIKVLFSKQLIISHHGGRLLQYLAGCVSFDPSPNVHIDHASFHSYNGELLSDQDIHLFLSSTRYSVF
ncbi:hypothetical protein OPV22_001164 [Ensete ventricosum]|uniref:Fatty acid hydroxylase domain-containing protein n=1 Tax=Ensete ventricosum TaxID=4639 RepID=A0AAV8RVL5_ENSVE|nr:hypothetical protein OPV22_001164 [Ensete ventricosum]